MNTRLKYCVFALTGLIILVLGAAVLAAPSAKAAGATYYVDCSAGSNGSGTQASPWNNLTTVNGTTFAAGDQILFKRGTTCVGQLWPKGSGVSGSPITVSDYGSGARTVIDGNNAVNIVVYLKDQSYWVIDSLEIKNGLTNGLYVDGSAGASLTYFRITDIYAHNVGDGNIGTGSGQDAIALGGWQKHSVHDVIIDNVEGSYAFRGIEIMGPAPLAGAARSSDIIIRNALTYEVQNDGILVASSNNAVVENSVAYRTGIQTTQVNHTPNGIWSWDTDNVVVQFCEAYQNYSLGNDGGSYDIDYYNSNQVVQYSYGHDNQGYGVSIFGAESNFITSNAVVRYNIFSYNDRKSGASAGDIVLSTWSRGKIDGVQIYNNTSYWSPTDATASAITASATFTGTLPRFAKNNIIYSAVPGMINVSGITLDYNLYWHTGGAPKWTYGGKSYTSFSAYQSGSGQDAHGIYADPLLNSPTYHGIGMPTTQFTLQAGSPAINAGVDVCIGISGCSMGTHDFFGNAIPNGAYDIGAYESGGAPLPTPTVTNTPLPPPPTNTPGGPTNTPTPTNTPLPGGGNLALGKPATAYTQSGSYGPANAVDGSTTSSYRAGSTGAYNWLKVNLQASYGVSQVVVKWYTNIGRYATAYSIQVSSDDTNWTTVYSTTAGDGGTDTINFSTVNASYVRLYSTAWNSKYGDYIAEFEVY